MIRLLRGQVVVRELTERRYGPIIIPDSAQDSAHKESTSHRGTVLAMGAPATMPNGVEVDPGYTVGDTVQFHWEHNEVNYTGPWEDGKFACWLSQHCIDAVIDE
jgi:co-chaperonin GroES (HSP10)